MPLWPMGDGFTAGFTIKAAIRRERPGRETARVNYRTRNPSMPGGSVMRIIRLKGAGGAADGGGLAPVVFVGGAVVGTLDNQVVVGDGLAIAESGQRVAVRIKQGKINIGGTGVVKSEERTSGKE